MLEDQPFQIGANARHDADDMSRSDSRAHDEQRDRDDTPAGAQLGCGARRRINRHADRRCAAAGESDKKIQHEKRVPAPTGDEAPRERDAAHDAYRRKARARRAHLSR
jgi:hypothetical protein